MSWYSKIEIKPGEELLCPVCQSQYPFGATFDHHKRVCPKCGEEVLEWHLDKKIVLISLKESPKELVPFFELLKRFSEVEALEILNSLDDVLSQ